jgi:hypothetical protein
MLVANRRFIEGFKDARVASRFSLNLLSLPGAVKAIMADVNLGGER